ncbi:hypothetical protein ACFQMB_04295 [Pseudobowmanella zhangzhouensis]
MLLTLILKMGMAGGQPQQNASDIAKTIRQQADHHQLILRGQLRFFATQQYPVWVYESTLCHTQIFLHVSERNSENQHLMASAHDLVPTRTGYVFNGKVTDTFPTLGFWWHRLTSAMSGHPEPQILQFQRFGRCALESGFV